MPQKLCFQRGISQVNSSNLELTPSVFISKTFQGQYSRETYRDCLILGRMFYYQVEYWVIWYCQKSWYLGLAEESIYFFTCDRVSVENCHERKELCLPYLLMQHTVPVRQNSAFILTLQTLGEQKLKGWMRIGHLKTTKVHLRECIHCTTLSLQTGH